MSTDELGADVRITVMPHQTLTSAEMAALDAYVPAQPLRDTETRVGRAAKRTKRIRITMQPLRRP